MFPLTLQTAEIPFDEIIINLDTPPQKAESKTKDTPSTLGRLLRR